MVTVLIAYASHFGNTKKMALAIGRAFSKQDDVNAHVVNCEDVVADDCLKADAIILGSPVKMGGIDWQLKKMIDTQMGMLWANDQLVGKVGGVFASGGGYGKGGAGVELTMVSLANVLMELGLIYVPLPKNTCGYEKGGLQWGAYGVSADESMNPIEISEESLHVAQVHASNIVRVAAAINGVNLLGPQLQSESVHARA